MAYKTKTGTITPLTSTWQANGPTVWVAIISEHRCTITEIGHGSAGLAYHVHVAGQATRVATLALAKRTATEWATRGVL